MKATLTISEEDIKKLIIEEFRLAITGHFDEKLVKIEVKSKQNYKSEWENAEFRATYTGEIK